MDDGPHHIEDYKKYFPGKVCIFHSPWNRSILSDNRKVFRITNWYEFENILPKLRFTSPFRMLLEDIDTIK